MSKGKYPLDFKVFQVVEKESKGYLGELKMGKKDSRLNEILRKVLLVLQITIYQLINEGVISGSWDLDLVFSEDL